MQYCFRSGWTSRRKSTFPDTGVDGAALNAHVPRTTAIRQAFSIPNDLDHIGTSSILSIRSDLGARLDCGPASRKRRLLTERSELRKQSAARMHRPIMSLATNPSDGRSPPLRL